MSKSTKIRKSARGENCLVRLPGICRNLTETTVFAHLGGGGMGAKAIDLHGAYCCADCHDVIDGRRKSGIPKDDLRRWHIDGVLRTQEVLLKKGLVKI